MHNSKRYYNKGIIKKWPSGMLTQTQLSQLRFYAKLNDVKTFNGILRAISFSEAAMFQICKEGLKIIVEEDKTVQASVYFNKNDYGFSEYQYKELNDEDIISFSINLKVIVENLNMFSEDESQLEILYKGDCAPLIMIIESEEDDLTTECSIKTRKLNLPLNLEKNDENIVALITFRGYDFFNFFNDLLKAVPSAEDFELVVSTEGFATIRRGTAEYNLDKCSDIIISFKCLNDINIKYKSAHLKLLLKILQLSKTTTLSVDKDGMLGVQVMIEDENQFQSFVEYLVLPLEEMQ